MQHRLAHRLIGLLVVGACSAVVNPAVAANHVVNVGNDKTLSPNSGNAVIAASDSVTWTWVGPDTDHIIAAFTGQAEQWDSDPGVNNIDHVVGHTFAHTFTTPGAYTYRCRIHPDKMSGTITVNATGNPTATFTMAPSPTTVGTPVQFDAMASSDPDGILVAWDWDLDGNGTFETSGATPQHTYATSGAVTVTLRVTDNAAKTHVAAQTLVVNAPPPPPPPPVSPPILPVPAPVTVTPLITTPRIPTLSLAAAPRQRGTDTKGIAFTAACDIACTVTALGSIVVPGGRTIKLGALNRTLVAGQTTKMTLTVPASSRAALRTHFKRGKAATATITLRSAEGRPVKRTVKLVK